MGDRRRGEVLAAFVRHHFPASKYPRVLLPADGNFTVANLLNGYMVTVIDPKPRGKKVGNVEVRKGLFHSSDNYSVDLIVGLHPDGATGEILDFSVTHGIPCVLVPCCSVGKYSDRGEWGNFIPKFFERRGFQVEEFYLKFSGKNVLFKAIP